MMSGKTVELIELINKARELKNNFLNKRVVNYGFDYNPVVQQSIIKELEQKYRVEIPDQYIEFIKFVGNGGAGPFDGIMSLESVFFNRKIVGNSKENTLVFNNDMNEISYVDEMADNYRYYLESYSGGSFSRFLNLTEEQFEFFSENPFEKFVDDQQGKLLKSYILDGDSTEYELYCEMIRNKVFVIGYSAIPMLEYGIVLDGIYKDRIVVFSLFDGKMDILEFGFLDWLIDYYLNVLS